MSEVIFRVVKGLVDRVSQREGGGGSSFSYNSCVLKKGHSFIGYPKGRMSREHWVSHSLGLYLLHQILAKARARRASNDCRATRSLFS